MKRKAPVPKTPKTISRLVCDVEETIYSDSIFKWSEVNCTSCEAFDCVQKIFKIPNVVCWRQRNFVNDVMSLEILFPHVAFVFPGNEFMKLIAESEDGFTFSALREYISRIKEDIISLNCFQELENNSNIVFHLIFHDLDSSLVDFQKVNKHVKRGTNMLLNQTTIDNVFTYLFLEIGTVKVAKLKKSSEVAEYLVSLGAVLMKNAAKAQNSNATALHFYKKKSISRSLDSGSVDGSDDESKDQSDKSYRDTYLRMLLAIPGMGEKKARHLMGFYSSPRVLREAILNGADISDKFDPRIKNTKLAKIICELYTKDC